MIPRPGKVGERKFLECEIQTAVEMVRQNWPRKKIVSTLHAMESEAECWAYLKELQKRNA